jgi:hypothetical protein
MAIVLQEVGKSFCWIDDLFVTPLSITRGQVSLGIWLSETVHDVLHGLDKLLRVRCDGNCHWLYPQGGPRMLALQLKAEQRVSYDHRSQISVQRVDADRLTLRLDGYRQPLVKLAPTTRWHHTASYDVKRGNRIGVQLA